ncbi:MAG: hypothetical protein ACRYG7_02775 [Janthinobacterium lividum]
MKTAPVKVGAKEAATKAGTHKRKNKHKAGSASKETEFMADQRKVGGANDVATSAASALLDLGSMSGQTASLDEGPTLMQQAMAQVNVAKKMHVGLGLWFVVVLVCVALLFFRSPSLGFEGGCAAPLCAQSKNHHGTHADNWSAFF